MEELPREIVQLINSFTDEKSKRSLRQTCTRLFDIIDYSHFTLYFTRSRMMPEIVQTLSRYDKPISLTFTKTIDLTPQAINHLSSLTNIINLEFDIEYSLGDNDKMVDLTRLTNLHSLHFSECNHAELLTSFHSLTRIDISDSLEEESNAVLQSNAKLVDLQLGLLHDLSHVQNINHVTSLDVELDRKDGADALSRAHRLQTLTVKTDLPLLELPLRALTALKSLTIRMESNGDVKYLSDIGHLDLHELIIRDAYITKEATCNWTSLTNLTSLYLSPLFKNEGSEDYLEFLTALSRLVTFGIFEEESRSENDYCINLFPDTLTALELSLKPNLSLSDFSRLTALKDLLIFNAEEDVPFDYHGITSLTQLTSINVWTDEKSETLTCVQHLTNLKRIAISSFSNVGENFFDFSKLPNLESLKLPSINAETFATLSSLSKLTLLKAKFTAECVPHVLERLVLLKELHVPRKQSEEFWQSLVKLTTLESLAVWDVHSEDKIISLTTLTNLTYLSVYNTSHVSYQCFTCLSSLQWISFKRVHAQECSLEELQTKMPYLYKGEYK